MVAIAPSPSPSIRHCLSLAAQQPRWQKQCIWLSGCRMISADDTQVYGAVTAFTSDISTTSWMRSNRLQPNPEKTEVVWCATTRRQHQLPTSPLLIDGRYVSPCGKVCSRPGYLHWLWSVNADTRQTYCIKVFWLTTSTSSDPPFGADPHAPDAGGRTGTHGTGLR